MRAIKGNIGAETAEKWNGFEKIAVKQKDNARTSLNPVECGKLWVFSSQGREAKEDARSSGLAEKDLTFYANRFT
jgi:hypothetical protein